MASPANAKCNKEEVFQMANKMNPFAILDRCPMACPMISECKNNTRKLVVELLNPKFIELEEDDLPTLSDYEAGMNYTLAQLDERNGASDAVIEGHVFNIREGSGLIFRDKETKRLIRNGDDRKNAEPDLRVKMIFDDGSGSCTAYLNREITEKLIGRDLDLSLIHI